MKQKSLIISSEPTSTTAKRNGETVNYDGIDFVFVEGGTFMMGCTSEQGDDCDDNEKPAHRVTVSDFYIGKYEVTQAQWEPVMFTTVREQSKRKTQLKGEGDNYPIYNVSWDEVQKFIRRLNNRSSKQYRLPTEAEWEFAARGGNNSKGYNYSGSNTTDNVGWYNKNSGDKILDDDSTSDDEILVSNNNKMHPVGTKSPNELGIYDMSGNVFEWCGDLYGNYNGDAQTNPQGPSLGFWNIVRGGCWYFSAPLTRVSHRKFYYPGDRRNFLGLRKNLPKFNRNEASSDLGFRLACS